MIQSDALSRLPDLCPDEDTDNENIVMLPDKMFVNLIDMDLQNQIAIANDLDSDVAQALKLLLEEAPTEMTTGLQDWTLETTGKGGVVPS